MAKDKQHEVRTDKKLENTPEQKTTAEDTKENQPASRKEDCARKAVLSSLRGLSKSRSPLSDTSSMLLQQDSGNESDVNHVESASEVNKDTPSETHADVGEAKVGGAERDGRHHATNEDVSHRPPQKASTAHPGGASAGSRNASTVAKSRSRNPRRAKGKKSENNASQNRKVTDFFPIRRSNRKTKGELKNEEQKHIDELLKNGVEEGMQVRVIEGKGRGVFASRGFTKGDFVVEYHGDLLELAEAKQREARYAQEPQTGCYMYYFQYHSKTYCVDATEETSRLGRLVNHSKAGNCHTKLHAVDGVPHLILVASRDIEADEELLYDYGDRSKASILAHPWLKH